MPPQPRRRACQNCHSIKIKCELGTTGGDPPCERCTRLGKDCAIFIPKRQKDRVAELEAQVAALTKLLEAQGISQPDSESSQDTPPSITDVSPGSLQNEAYAQKKRKLDDAALVPGFEQYPSASQIVRAAAMAQGEAMLAGSKAAQLLSQEQQDRVFEFYVNTICPMFPAVPLPRGSSANELKLMKPMVYDAAIFAAGSCMISVEVQDEIMLALLDGLASAALVNGLKSLELLQAAHIVCLWYRAPMKHSHIATFQLVSIAASMAVDLGFGGAEAPPSLDLGPIDPIRYTLEAKRSWLVSYLVTAATATYRRKPTEQQWSLHHDMCLADLQSDPEALPSDRLLGQFVRAERLYATICDRLSFADITPCPEVGQPLSKYLTGELEAQIAEFKRQVPPELNTPAMLLSGYHGDILVHEPVLHTSTSKLSFTAPYLCERLSATDFPVTTVTQSHIHALQTITTACHAIVNIALSFSDDELLHLPTFLFPPRIAYATWILLKLHVTVTGPGNTFGRVLSPDEVQADVMLDRTLIVANRARAVNQNAIAVRILANSLNMKTWLHKYNTSIGIGANNFQTFGDLYRPVAQGVPPGLPEKALQVADAQMQMNSNVVEPEKGALPVDGMYDNYFGFDMGVDDFGFTDLFTGPDGDIWNLDSGMVDLQGSIAGDI